MTEKEILQQITRQETDIDHVRRLAAEHNADLSRWCARRKTMYRLFTDTVIAVSVATLVVITVLPDPDGHYLSNAQARKETLQNIDQTLIASL